MNEDTEAPDSMRVGRRTNITGAAWSIPAVAIAVTSSTASAAPAVSAVVR